MNTNVEVTSRKTKTLKKLKLFYECEKILKNKQVKIKTINKSTNMSRTHQNFVNIYPVKIYKATLINAKSALLQNTPYNTQ